MSNSKLSKVKKLLFISLVLLSALSEAQILKKPIPDKLVVLSFDDAVLSHYTNVAPILKKYGFGATFFVTEFIVPPFSDKTKYMSWEQIGELGKMGFEIGNHTYHHTHVNKMDSLKFVNELNYIEEQTKQVGVKGKMVSFAYPGYDTAPSAIKVLHNQGYEFARTGGGRPYNPLKDHPLLIPSFSTSGDNSQKIYKAFDEAKDGKIIVLTIHGVPDEAHPWVNTPLELFQKYMDYLYQNHFKVIAMRDLADYINPIKAAEIIKPEFNKTK